MFSYLVYSRDTVVYIRVRKTFPRLLYLDERCEEKNSNDHLINGYIICYLMKSLYAKIGTSFSDADVTLSIKR